jgi:hypothetical protein
MDRFAEEISVFIVNRNNKFINMYWKMALLLLLKQLEEKESLPDKEADQMAWVRAANQHRLISFWWTIRISYLIL